jgi:hypothetical protein
LVVIRAVRGHLRPHFLHIAAQGLSGSKPSSRSWAGRSGRHPLVSSLASSASTSTLMTPKKLMLSLWPGEMCDRISSLTARPCERSSSTALE